MGFTQIVPALVNELLIITLQITQRNITAAMGERWRTRKICILRRIVANQVSGTMSTPAGSHCQPLLHFITIFITHQSGPARPCRLLQQAYSFLARQLISIRHMFVALLLSSCRNLFDTHCQRCTFVIVNCYLRTELRIL